MDTWPFTLALHKIFLIDWEEAISAAGIAVIRCYTYHVNFLIHATPSFSWQLAKKQQDGDMLQGFEFSAS